MPAEKDAIIIGLTGSFGSGCSKMSEVIETEFDFERFSLSDAIREEATSQGSDSRKANLQKIGTKGRKEGGPDYWAQVVNEKIKTSSKKIVIDSIRNTNEVKFFKKNYTNFYLMGVDCGKEERWDRIKTNFINQAEFELADRIDADEEGGDSGQQVKECVRMSDILINNSTHCLELGIRPTLKEKAKPFINFITGSNIQPPTVAETAMANAYFAAYRSSCFKRQVGAVIAAQGGVVLSTGYNENPRGLGSCLVAFDGCYKDKQKETLWKDFWNWPGIANYPCPQCKENIGTGKVGICSICGFDFFDGRGLELCSALHAEEMAIWNASGKNLEGSTMYVTSFPCLLCAKKIIEAKMKNVIYVEPYPSPDLKLVLELFVRADVKVDKFEGVTGNAYKRFFENWPRSMVR